MIAPHRLVAAAVRGAARSPDPIDVTTHRVRLADVDANLHMNQAAWFEVMEVARWSWALRNRVVRGWTRGNGAVVGQQALVYKRELPPLARFSVDTRLVGFDRRAVVFEQTFLRAGQPHGVGRVNGLFQEDGRLMTREVTEARFGELIRDRHPAAVEAWPEPT